MKEIKSIDEILKQPYITAQDLRIIIPKLSYARSIKYIDDIRTEMEEKNYFVPDGKTKVALTKLVRKKFGI